MSSDQIDYGRLVQRALLHVVREALAQVADHGLPGRHHLYITFRTDHPDVELADELYARYPSEMTIVLQHEYWGLDVQDDAFAVTLSFSNRPQRIHVPYEAITVFADPSVEFGLQFAAPEALESGSGETGDAPKGPPASVSELPQKPGEDRPADDKAAADGEAEESGPAEVVTLDRFRKK